MKGNSPVSCISIASNCARFWTVKAEGARTMGSLTSLTDPAALLVADASAVINLNATGCAAEILKALPNPVAVTDVVPGELETGRSRGRRNADMLQELVTAGLINIVPLNDAAAAFRGTCRRRGCDDAGRRRSGHNRLCGCTWRDTDHR